MHQAPAKAARAAGEAVAEPIGSDEPSASSESDQSSFEAPPTDARLAQVRAGRRVGDGNSAEAAGDRTVAGR